MDEKIKNEYSFEPKTSTEKGLDKVLEEIKSATEDVVTVAGDCMASDLFAKYRQEYKTAEKALINMLKKLNTENQQLFGWAAMVIAVKLDILGQLNDSIERDMR